MINESCVRLQRAVGSFRSPVRKGPAALPPAKVGMITFLVSEAVFLRHVDHGLRLFLESDDRLRSEAEPGFLSAHGVCGIGVSVFEQRDDSSGGKGAAWRSPRRFSLVVGIDDRAGNAFPLRHDVRVE